MLNRYLCINLSVLVVVSTKNNDDAKDSRARMKKLSTRSFSPGKPKS